MPATDGSPDLYWRLVIILHDHRRRALTELCACSTRDAPVRWTEHHVASLAVAHGVVPAPHTGAA